MEILDAIDQAFAAYRASGRTPAALEVWRERRPELSDVEGVDDLVGRCRGPRFGSRREKDRIHVALCLEASSCPSDGVAGVVLSWLFIPGLADLFKSLAGSGVDPDEVFADLLGGFWEAAMRVGPTSTHVARHLLRGARRQALRGLRMSGELHAEHNGEGAIDAALSPEGQVDDRLHRAIRAGVVSQEQVELVFATRSSIRQVAARHSMSLQAAQQARHRARQRLRAWLAAS